MNSVSAKQSVLNPLHTPLHVSLSLACLISYGLLFILGLVVNFALVEALEDGTQRLWGNQDNTSLLLSRLLAQVELLLLTLNHVWVGGLVLGGLVLLSSAIHFWQIKKRLRASPPHGVTSASPAVLGVEGANPAYSDPCVTDDVEEWRSHLCHELRTPLAAIVQCLDSMGNQGELRGSRAYCQAASAAADMLELLNRSLDVSKLSSQKLELRLEPFSLSSMVKKVTEQAAIMAHRKNIELLLDISPETPDLVLGDEFRIRQVLNNLLSNALKFTDEGQVSLGLEAQPLPNQELALHLWVTDTGKGIEESQLPSLFQAYSQNSGQSASQYGGTGLGLYLCKMLVDKMGGQIQVHSRLGEGTSFHVRLVLELRQQGVKPLPQRDESRVLWIINDVDALSSLMKHHLQPYYGHVYLSAPGSTAVIEPGPAVGQVDVLLNHSAFNAHRAQVLEMIHRMRERGDSVHLTLLTSGLLTGLQGGGCLQDLAPDRILIKPVCPAELIHPEWESVLGCEPSQEEAQVVSLKGVRVLLAEDSPTLRGLLQDALMEWGAEVTAVCDGVEAVAAVLSPGNQFDVVLMDVEMPYLNGLDATERIRSHRHLECLPILAMSSHSMESYTQKCLKSGMNEHLHKPVHRLYLAQRIRHYVPMTATGPVIRPVLNEQGPSVGLAFHPELYRRSIARFIQEYQGFCEVSSNSSEAISGSDVHRLRGAAGMLGLRVLSDLCRVYEESFEAIQPDKREVLSRQIRKVLNDAIGELRTKEQSLAHPEPGA